MTVQSFIVLLKLTFFCTAKVILFVSDGLPSDEIPGVQRNEEILRVISEENAKLNNLVIIHTYGIGHNGGEHSLLFPF